MNWQVEWKAIAGRISGITAAGEFFVRALQVSPDDPYQAAVHLAEQAIDIANDLEAFRKRVVGIAPQKAVEAIAIFLDKHRMRMNDPSLRGVERLKVSLVPLAWLRAKNKHFKRDFSAPLPVAALRELAVVTARRDGTCGHGLHCAGRR